MVELSTLGAPIGTAYEGEANKNPFTDAEQTKLSGIAAGADVTSTAGSGVFAVVGHGHASGAITDFTEAVQDAVGAFFTAGTGISVSYDDVANTLTVAATGSGGGDAWSDPVDATITLDTHNAHDIGTDLVRVRTGYFVDVDVSNGVSFANATADVAVAGDEFMFAKASVGGAARKSSGMDASVITAGALADARISASSVIQHMSNPTGVTGADQITNMMSMTEAEHTAATKVATVLYFITDAV